MRRCLAVAFALSAGGLVPAAAHAHFILQEPANWIEQASLGDPQKTAPCGPGPGEATVLTNMTATLSQGGQVRVTINETVPQPGHYRVALSTTGQAGLPADPTVTPSASDQCASKEIMNPPVYPVLADGMLPHTAAFSGPQTFMVQLPANVTCNANCVLQVTEYMQNHGAPCFYHHCAALNISDNPPPQVDGPPTPGQEAGVDPPGGDGDASGGCCSSSRGAPSAATLGLLVLGLVLRRRR